MHGSLQKWIERSDEGMSIVEVLIASVILLVALTSMLGLLMTSTGLSARARSESLAVTTGSRFIEQVRALPYAQITQSKLNTLAAAATSASIGGMTVSVTASFTPVWEASQSASDPPAYKHVTVRVHITGRGFKAFDFSTGTYVREWKWTQRTTVLPTVDFDSGTPAAGATARPVWGTIHIGAIGHSQVAEVMLTQLYVKIATTQLTSATPNAMDGSCSTNWDTTTAADGEYTLFAEVWDALNGKDSKSRTFAIDNVVPPAPGAAVLSQTTGNSPVLWKWGQVLDGITPVPGYAVTMQQQASSGTWTTVSTASQPRPSDLSSATASLATEAFSHYQIGVAAIGPREWSAMTTPWRSSSTSGASVTTRPTLGGTLTINASSASADFAFTPTILTVTPPTFPYSSAQYKWQYRIDPNGGGTGTWTDFPVAASPNLNPSTATSVTFAKVTGPAKKTPAAILVRCIAKVVDSSSTVYYDTATMSVLNPAVGTIAISGMTPDWATASGVTW